MSDISAYNGKDLLKLFRRLDINLGNVSSNVIEAWFDTDDNDTLRLLNWICSSLSEENVIPIQIKNEYLNLPKRLEGDDLETAKNDTDFSYPNIFDLDFNIFEVELLKNQVETLVEHDRHLSDLIIVNENLQKSLIKELNDLYQEEAVIDDTLTNAEQQCTEVAKILENRNQDLVNRCTKYGAYLHEFEYAELPQFLNAIDMGKFVENFGRLAGHLNIISREHQEVTESISAVNYDDLNIISNRLVMSYSNELKSRINEQSFLAVSDFLENYNYKSNLKDISLQLEMEIESKLEESEKLIDTLNQINEERIEQLVSQPKIIRIQQDYDNLIKILNFWTTILIELPKIGINCYLTYLFYLQKKMDIDNVENVFSDIFYYVSKNISNGVLRNNAMEQIIDNFRIYQKSSIQNKFPVLNLFAAVFKSSESDLLNEIYEIFLQRENEIKTLEKRLYVTDFFDNKQVSEEIKKHQKLLENFIFSGPTYRVKIIPMENERIMNELKEVFQKQESSIKWTMQIFTEASNKLKSDKWFQKFRHLWIYFLTNREKLLDVLKEIQNESSMYKEKLVQFKAQKGA